MNFNNMVPDMFFQKMVGTITVINKAKANVIIRVTFTHISAFPESSPIANPVISAIMPMATDIR